MKENVISEQDARVLSSDQQRLLLAVAPSVSEIGFKSLMCVFIDGATRLMGIDTEDERMVRATAHRLNVELTV